MDTVKKHHQVVAAVIVDDGEVLCMQRGLTRFAYTSYKWEFPGGKIEAGESPEEALRREIREEMAMDVRVGRHIVTVEHEYRDFCITMAAYLCEPVCNVAENTQENRRAFTMNEHHAFRWLRPEALPTLEWAAADVGIVEEVVKLGVGEKLQ